MSSKKKCESWNNVFGGGTAVKSVSERSVNIWGKYEEKCQQQGTNITFGKRVTFLKCELFRNTCRKT